MQRKMPAIYHHYICGRTLFNMFIVRITANTAHLYKLATLFLSVYELYACVCILYIRTLRMHSMCSKLFTQICKSSSSSAMALVRSLSLSRSTMYFNQIIQCNGRCSNASRCCPIRVRATRATAMPFDMSYFNINLFKLQLTETWTSIEWDNRQHG